jgi:ABC-type phosphate/phosphonate transport system substrate-binding protein
LSAKSFRRPQDLQGVTVAWVSKESASGYFVPRWHLRSLGLPLESCFDREIFCESHEAVARAVLGGTADVGATHVALEPVSGQLARAPWQALGARPSSIRVLLLIGPIPGDVIAAARHVPLSSCRNLTAALLSIRQDGAGRLFDATRFEPVPEGHLRRLLGLRAQSDE